MCECARVRACGRCALRHLLAHGHVLIKHLEHVEVGRLNLTAAQVGPDAVPLELGEMHARRLRYVLLEAGLEVRRLRHDVGEGVNDLHRVVAQIHQLVERHVVVRRQLRPADSGQEQ